MSDMPWSKFFWSDWDSDEGLKQCSLAAQGLWMRMLCICAKGDPIGYLAIAGNPLDVRGVAKAAGIDLTEAETLMAELDQWGVFSRDRSGRIYSRRMVREAKRSAEGRKHVKKRWSQDTEKTGENPGPNRGSHRGPTTQKPEARDQSREKEEANASSKKPEGGSGKGTRLDPGWKPDPELIQFARDAGLPPSQVALEAEKFRDYWLAVAGQKGVKRDWPATWRNWIRNAKGASPNAAGKPPAPQTGLTDHEWQNAMRRWVDTGEWLADAHSPAPDQPGCRAPAEMLRHAAKLVPEKSDAILANLQPKGAAA